PPAPPQTSPWEPAAALAQGRLLVVLNLLGATEVRPLIESTAALLGLRSGARALAGSGGADLAGVEGRAGLELHDLPRSDAVTSRPAGPLRIEGAGGHIPSDHQSSEGLSGKN
ncbi:MAG: hypothetical protein DIU70_012010, partial [Bacillota bacterium]